MRESLKFLPRSIFMGFAIVGGLWSAETYAGGGGCGGGKPRCIFYYNSVAKQDWTDCCINNAIICSGPMQYYTEEYKKFGYANLEMELSAWSTFDEIDVFTLKKEQTLCQQKIEEK